MSTLVTLADIWAAPAEEVNARLVHKGITPTTRTRRNRATLAVVYYNEGMLAADEKQWVAHPR